MHRPSSNEGSVQRRRCVGATRLRWLLFAGIGLLASATVSAQQPSSAPNSAGDGAAVLRAPLEGETQTTLPDGRVLILGGTRATIAARIFDPSTGQTVALPEHLKAARRLQSATVLPNGQVLVLGGLDGNGNIPTLAERFDPLSNRFESAGDPGLLARAGHSAKVLTDGTLLIVGGRGTRGEAITQAEQFDPRSGRVHEVDRQPALDRSGATVQLLNDGRVLVTGGRDAAGKPQATALVYQVDQQRFVPLQPKEAEALRPVREPAVPAQLAGSLPRRDDASFDPNNLIGLRFDQVLLPTSVRAENMSLIGPTGPVKATVAPSDDGLLAFITPERPLMPGTRYTVVVRGVQTVSGAAMPLTTLAFSTRDLGGVPGDAKSTSAAGRSTSSTAAGAAGANAAGTAAGATEEPVTVTVPKQALDDDEVFVPTAANYLGRWRTSRPLPRDIEQQLNDAITLKVSLAWENAYRGQKSPLLKRMKPFAERFPRLTTGVSGVVLKLNDQPLANAELSIGNRKARTDGFGRFALLGLSPGHYEIYVDGSGAGAGGVQYGKFVIGADVEAGEVTELPAIYLPKIRQTDWVDIPNPVRQDIVVTHPNVPGMEIRIPKGAVLRERDGRLVTKLALIPVPLDRTPFPFPTNAPVYVSVQPGSLVVQGLTPGVTRGVRVIYPNATFAPAGNRARFWKYDPTGKGWYIYGEGQVSADARQVLPDPGVENYDAIGFMYNPDGQNSDPQPPVPPSDGCPNGAPPDKPCPPPREGKPKPTKAPGGNGGGPCPNTQDPVDCGTGLFVHSATDLALTDILPVYVTRNYRQGDSVVRPFGLGTSHPFATYLRWPTNSVANDTYMWMVLSDGSTKTFNRIATTPEVLYEYTGTDPGLHKARIRNIVRPETNESLGRWQLKRRDGSVLEFDSYVAGYGLTRMSDRLGNSVTFVRNAGRITRMLSPSGRYIDFTYDASNRITQATDIAGRVFTYDYTTACTANGSPQGYLCKVTDPDNRTEEYKYDALGRMTEIKDKRGNTVVTNTYDANSRVIRQDYPGSVFVTYAYTVDGSGKVTQTDMTDARSVVTRMSFNAAGLMTSRIEAYGTALARTTTYEYQAGTNLMTATVDGLGRRTEYDYDAMGNVTTVRSLAGTGNQLTETYTYTADFNQLATYTDPRSKTTQYFYDLLGRLTEVKDPLLNSTKFEYNPQGLVTRILDPRNQPTDFTYALNDLASIKDPLNRTTNVFTDLLGRVIQVTDPLGNRTQSAYDKLSRLTSVIDPLGNTVTLGYDNNGNLTTFTDPRSGVTTFGYDARNRLTTRTDPLTKTETLVLDGNDNVTSRTDRKSQVTSTTYDALNRPLVTTWQGGATTGYTFDAGNRLTQIADSVSGTITRQYDIRFDTVTQEVVPLGAGTSTINITFDAAGRRTQMQVVGQTAVTYGFDDANRLTSVTQGANAVGFTYDAASRRTVATLPNSVSIEYGYDNANQLTSITHKRLGATLQALSYTYDLAGRRITMGGTAARVNLPPALASATYDANNRLTNWGGTTLTYDFNGNLTNDGVQSYTWDTRDRLTALSGSIAASFGYDAFNRRYTKTVGGTQSGTLYDGYSEVHNTTGATINSTYLNGLSLDERYARTQGGVTLSFLPDALGSTLNLVSPGGAMTGTFTYEPYGSSTQSGVDDTKFRYTGREEDGTGLMYYRNRYYSPRFSRFVSEDPIGLAGGYNLFAYVEGDPITYSDPDGLQGITGFTRHGLNQAINRGVSPAAMRDAVVCPITISPQPNGTTRYIGSSAVVVLNPAGQVVTCWCTR
jgi:RHS repeat-associated protein